MQPGEIAKITLILGLGKLLDYFKTKGKLNNPLYVLVILLYVAIPTVLIIMQPDYGTAMVFLVVAALMIFISGINIWYIVGAITTVFIGVILAYNFILPDYAKSRITVFLNPETDPSGAGYNIIQSQLAVGSGQMWGMGLFNGNQSQLRISTNENNGFYICSNKRRNGIYNIMYNSCIICCTNIKKYLYRENI